LVKNLHFSSFHYRKLESVLSSSPVSSAERIDFVRGLIQKLGLDEVQLHSSTAVVTYPHAENRLEVISEEVINSNLSSKYRTEFDEALSWLNEAGSAKVK